MVREVKDALAVAAGVIYSLSPRGLGAWGDAEWRPGSVLVARRKPGLRQAGFWEFPGGKREAGELGPACLVRELKEELAMEVAVGAFLGLHPFEGGGQRIALEAWLCEWQGGTLRPVDHDLLAWALPSELGLFRWSPADLPFVERLMAEEVVVPRA